MQTLALDATLVIAITFLGTTMAGIVLPWRQKNVFDGSPIAKYKVPPGWAGWSRCSTPSAAVYLIYLSFQYADAGLRRHVGRIQTPLTWFDGRRGRRADAWSTPCCCSGSLYYVGPQAAGGAKHAADHAGRADLLGFLDWLLVEWFWDPHVRR